MTPRSSRKRHVDPDPGLAQLDRSLLENATAHYHATLKSSGVVLERIKWRGAVGMELVEHFRLGFCDGTLRQQLGLRHKKNVELDHALARLGLVRSNGVESFSGSLVVPVFDATGQVVALRGGAYHPFSESNRAERAIPLGHEPVFHRSGFRSPELIVTGTALDALRFWYAGHTHVTATARGLSLSDEQLALMKEAKIERVLLAWRSSAGGEPAALSAAKRLTSAGIHAYRVRVDRRFMPTSRQWGELIKGAEPMLGAPARPEPEPIDLDWRRTKPGEAR